MGKSRGRWFRQYESTMDNPKVQMLSDWHYRAWNTLLCFASKHGGEFTGDVSILSFILRKPAGKVKDTMQVLLSAGLMVKTENGYKPHEWDDFQYQSDVSTDRVKRFRERGCNVSSTVSETAPERDTDTDSEAEEESEDTSLRSAPPQSQPDLLEIPAFLSRTPIPQEEPSTAVVPVTFDPLLRAIEAYNLTAKVAGWPEAQRLTDARRRSLKARLGEAGGLSGWCDAMARAARSSFLLGKTGRSGDHAKWRPSIKFFLQQESFTTLMEGGYDDPTGPQGSDAAGGALGRIAEAAAFAIARGDPSH